MHAGFLSEGAVDPREPLCDEAVLHNLLVVKRDLISFPHRADEHAGPSDSQRPPGPVHRNSHCANIAAWPRGAPAASRRFHTVARAMRKRRPLFAMRTPE